MWHLESKELVLKTSPFTVERLNFRTEPNGLAHAHPFYRLDCPDWVNILPITRDGEAILIRQFRPGPLTATLETPGGVVDEGERDTTLAAMRELEEETGYTTSRLLSLGNINPNPAIQTNRLHMFLALDCTKSEPRTRFPDATESIEVVPVKIEELDSLMRTGRIDSALCCLTICLAKKYASNL